MSYMTEYVAGPAASIFPVIDDDVIGTSQSIAFSISKEIGKGILGIGGNIIFSDIDKYRLPKSVSYFDISIFIKNGHKVVGHCTIKDLVLMCDGNRVSMEDIEVNKPYMFTAREIMFTAGYDQQRPYAL
jgi:hypothetical protein